MKILSRKENAIFLRKKKTVCDLSQLFKKSLFMISYNNHGISDRNIFYLKKKIFNNPHFFIKAFKNNLIKKAFFDTGEEKYEEFFKKEKIKGSNIIFFCFKGEENKFDIFEILSFFRKFNENVLGETKENRFNWALYNKEFLNSLVLDKWSSLPNRKNMIRKLIMILNYNLNVLVKCIQEIIKNKL